MDRRMGTGFRKEKLAETIPWREQSSNPGQTSRRPEIKRSGKFGEWKNWFTPEDVAFFKPRMEKFMGRYGYLLDWNLPDDQKINSITSIDYIKRYSGII